jgi:hypothetical protein
MIEGVSVIRNFLISSWWGWVGVFFPLSPSSWPLKKGLILVLKFLKFGLFD